MRLAGSDEIFSQLSATNAQQNSANHVENVIEQIELLREKGLVVMPLFITGLTFGTVEGPPCNPQDSLQFTVMSHPQTTRKAIQLIERFEGVEEDAYLDQVGVATIGAGMTKYPDGSFVRLGDHCSKQVCRGYLESMIENEYIPALAAIPGWTRLGPARQAVLISFA